MSLKDEHCVPCEGNVPPLSLPKAQALREEVPEWQLASNGRSLSRTFTFKNFVDAMDFAQRITPIAEAENHHPDLQIGWGKVHVELSTHAIGGLSTNDFILAAKIDEIAT